MSSNGIMLDAMFGYVRHYRTQARRKRAERILNAMPSHLRKDIGWPDSTKITGGE
ncbi:MAG: hypothetical protein JJ913_05620 [Rhizobiaceae bacterium]|nr:hypothetical protein [Rhizobiaceae bacterium]